MKQVKIHQGSNLDILPTLPDNSVDSIVTDPPYELGFMGKSWDSTGIAYNVEVWKQCLRVLKPGGHLVAFSGSRTYHRMAVAIEDAGFQIRDQIMWVYGSGFPKSHNIGKAVDKLQGNERTPYERPDFVARSNKTEQRASQVICGEKGKYTMGYGEHEGWGTALKPAHEPIVLARKPLEGTVAENVLKWGVGGINIDGCRVGTEIITQRLATVEGAKCIGGKGVGIKQKATGETTQTTGRFPANLMHDGSQEVLELFPNSGNGNGGEPYNYAGREYDNKETSMFNGDKPQAPSNFNDKGSAARFFYCPKANKKDRDEGCDDFDERRESDRPSDDKVGGDNPRNRSNTPRKNSHPTVKPTELMRYLCRLVTPPNGTVLDPFNGSGSTGKAAVLEGFNYIGIELDPEYIKISEARIQSAINAK